MSVSINPSVAGPSSTNDHLAATGAAVMSTGLVLFNVVGDIQILSLVSECYTDNGATASTLQFRATTSRAVSQTLCNASGSLANKAAGYAVALSAASTLTEAPLESASGVLINTASRGVRVPSGTINIVVGTGSTTGTWRHYLRYEPLESGAYATAAF